jgi:uncharacterized protein with PQ loop repeat
MNSAELALAAFTACNSVRVFAYLPQLMKISRDTEGAFAISYATWGMFTLSHLSTVAYALLAVEDLKMAAVFGANAICCSAILILTAYKRRRACPNRNEWPRARLAAVLRVPMMLAVPRVRTSLVRAISMLGTTFAVF